MISVRRDFLSALCPLDSEGQERLWESLGLRPQPPHSHGAIHLLPGHTHHSPEALLETPCHVIPQEVRAERRDQQVDRLHNLRGMSVVFDCAVSRRQRLAEHTDGGAVRVRCLKEAPRALVLASDRLRKHVHSALTTTKAFRTCLLAFDNFIHK